MRNFNNFQKSRSQNSFTKKIDVIMFNMFLSINVLQFTFVGILQHFYRVQNYSLSGWLHTEWKLRIYVNEAN